MADRRTLKIPVGAAYALVDAADFALVSQYTWHPGGTKGGYARATINGRGVYLHRLVMDACQGDIIDHRNGDPLDCRRANLRFVDSSGNAANRTATENPTGYRGVAWWEKPKRFQGRVQFKGSSYRGPYRNTAKEAAEDFDRLARALHGECASLNFPREGERGVRRRGQEGG